MAGVSLQGRLQCVDGPVKTLFDVAHNPQAVRLLKEFIVHQGIRGKIYAVFSALADKDLDGLIEPLSALVSVWYPARLTGERALTDAQLSDALHRMRVNCLPCFADPVSAYRAVLEQAESDDLIVVYGSFLTVGAVMASMSTMLEVG